MTIQLGVKRFKDITNIDLPDYKEEGHDKDYYLDIVMFDPKSKMQTHNYPVLDLDKFEEEFEIKEPKIEINKDTSRIENERKQKLLEKQKRQKDKMEEKEAMKDILGVQKEVS